LNDDEPLISEGSVFGAVASLFEAANAKYDRAFFAKTMVTNATVMLFLAFLTNWYTLGWWDAVLVPLLVVVGIMVAFRADKKEYRQVHKFFSGVRAVVVPGFSSTKADRLLVLETCGVCLVGVLNLIDLGDVAQVPSGDDYK